MNEFLNIPHLLAPDSERDIFANCKCTILGTYFFVQKTEKYNGAKKLQKQLAKNFNKKVTKGNTFLGCIY